MKTAKSTTRKIEKRGIEYSLEELRNTSVTNSALWEPFIPAVGISTVVGMPDSGKSMLCRNLALAVTFGNAEFLGMKLNTEHRRALFITTEDTLEATKECFIRQADTFTEAERAKSEKNLRIILADDLSPDEIIAKIHRYLKRMKFDVIIIDAYGDVFKGGEGNSNIQNRESLRPFSNIAKKYGTSIIFVHHTNKAAKNLAPDQIHVQGGSGFVQKIRTVLELRPSRSNGEIKYLACTKGNGVSNDYKRNAIEVKFDSDTFLYKATGKKKAVEDLKYERESGPTRHDIAASDLFKEFEATLTRAELVKRIKSIYGRSTSTAARWINDNLKSVKYGIYSNPDWKGEELKIGRDK